MTPTRRCRWNGSSFSTGSGRTTSNPIETLQEIFGYVLTPDTSQQKIGMIVGPKRSGKGLIGRTLRRLVGERNA